MARHISSEKQGGRSEAAGLPRDGTHPGYKWIPGHFLQLALRCARPGSNEAKWDPIARGFSARIALL